MPIDMCSRRPWDDVFAQRIAEGIDRQIVAAIHSCPHEQMTMVERGRVSFPIGDQSRLAQAGDVLHFPPHAAHGASR
jgi:quercetin dioxygenase-like cupin family protein